MEIIFLISVGIVFFISYGYKCSINQATGKLFHERYMQTPPLTVIVPCRNEEKNIAVKIKNLLSQNYPRNLLEIVVVDNESTDETLYIAKRFPVKIISAPSGKINAINAGLRCTKTDLVVITDADVRLSKNALKSAVSLLHGKVGAVTGMTCVIRRKNWYMDGKLKYHEKDWMLRYKESLLDSCCSLDGKLIVFRKSLVEKIPPDAYIDDFELTLIIRKKGFICVVDEHIGVFEPPAVNIKEELKQMRRRIQHTILTICRYMDMVFNKKYGYYGMLILPFRRVLPLFLPFFIFIIIIYIILTLKIFVVPVLMITTLLLFVTRKTTFYNFILLTAIVLAWYDVIFGKIEKNAKFERIKN